MDGTTYEGRLLLLPPHSLAKMSSAACVLANKRAGFLGLGRLGLCTALTFEQAGWDIVGSDAARNTALSARYVR
jgi:phosphoglycerate dehydrogenase-like enzyme